MEQTSPSSDGARESPDALRPLEDKASLPPCIRGEAKRCNSLAEWLGIGDGLKHTFFGVDNVVICSSFVAAHFAALLVVGSPSCLPDELECSSVALGRRAVRSVPGDPPDEVACAGAW